MGEEIKKNTSMFYSVSQITKMFSITSQKIYYWIKIGLLNPTNKSDKKIKFSFNDIVGIKIIKELMSQGVKPGDIIMAVEMLKKRLPYTKTILQDVHFIAHGGNLLITEDDKLIEAVSGQVIIDFDAYKKDRMENIKDSVLKFDSKKYELNLEKAKQYFMEGYEYETKPETWELAEKSYRKSIESNSEFVFSYINLGNLKYKQGYPEEAKQYYLKALELSPLSPEANYNIGYIYYEEGEPLKAIHHLKITISNDPNFPDAYFQLAFCLEEVGQKEEAKLFWKKYLSLEPDGPWAEIAKFILRK